MSTPELLPSDILQNVNVGLSVSESADLGRLGLQSQHADQAIAELARAILLAGGQLTYGGWLEPTSFTSLLMTEVTAYGGGETRLTLVVAFPEHRKLRLSVLDGIRDELGGLARLVYLDPVGSEVDPGDGRSEEPDEVKDGVLKRRSYTALRRVMAERTDARVIVGGKLSRFEGEMPGIIEEAITSVRAEQPLYVAGGFGGAAAAVARTLEIDPMDWLPANMPTDGETPAVLAALAELRQAANDLGWRTERERDGLTVDDRRLLSATFRPGDIASLVTVGLSHRFGDRDQR